MNNHDGSVLGLTVFCNSAGGTVGYEYAIRADCAAIAALQPGANNFDGQGSLTEGACNDKKIITCTKSTLGPAPPPPPTYAWVDSAFAA